MLRGAAALEALEEGNMFGKGKADTKDKLMPPPVFFAPRDWEKFAAGVMGPKSVLSGVCLLPIQRDDSAQADRKSVMCAIATQVPESADSPCHRCAPQSHTKGHFSEGSRGDGAG